MAQIDKRRAQAIDLRTRGWKWRDIAEECGYSSVQAAHADITDAVEKAAKDFAESAVVHVERALARLDHMYKAAQEILDRRHVRVSGGRVVRDLVVDDQTGRTVEVVVEDDMPALHALDRMLRIEQRRAALQGLDAPQRLDVQVYEYRVNGVDPKDVT